MDEDEAGPEQPADFLAVGPARRPNAGPGARHERGRLVGRRLAQKVAAAVVGAEQRLHPLAQPGVPAQARSR